MRLSRYTDIPESRHLAELMSMMICRGQERETGDPQDHKEDLQLGRNLMNNFKQSQGRAI